MALDNDDSCKNSEKTTDSNSNQYLTKLEGSGLPDYHLPVFLSLPQSTISRKFDLISQYEATLAAQPSAFLRHKRLSQRDRYANVRPWAHNTIQLGTLKFPDNYINASPISLGRNRESFIATQGPGPGDTILHFWQMVWQEKVEVIVMLTQCVEAGIEKCGAYLPSQPGENLSIRAKSEPPWGKVICVTQHTEEWGEIRLLRIIKNTDGRAFEEHQVHHLLFTRWPDHQVPLEKSDQMALINLIKLSRQKTSHMADPPKAHIPPRLIHCSAGVGRTGTFIALDHLLQELDENNLDHIKDDDDPVLNTVRRLREQRMGLVNNVQQYTLIYQLLRENWELRHLRPSVTRDPKIDRVSNTRKRFTDTLIRNFPKLSRG